MDQPTYAWLAVEAFRAQRPARHGGPHHEDLSAVQRQLGHKNAA